MIFSDRQIRQALGAGRFEITPTPDENQFAPSAVDLHIGDVFRRWKLPETGMAPLRLSELKIPDFASHMEDLPREKDGSVILSPGAFILSQTRERVKLPHDSQLAARVEGRSSFARLGLVVHMTAPTIHAGFEGNIVLEMMNFGPFDLVISPNHTHICQLIFEELGMQPSCELNTHFQNQSSVLGENKS